MDGTPMLSCIDARDRRRRREIRTIEGLGVGEHLHPVQEEFSRTMHFSAASAHPA